MKAKVLSLREQQKIAIRNELSQQGLALFLRYGFSNTTIEQIVEPVGMAKRTFFRYFKTKEELVFAWYEDKTPELVQELLSRPEEEEPFGAITATLTSTLKRYDANPEWAWKLVCLVKENPSLLGKGYEKQLARERALSEVFIARGMAPLQARILVSTATVAFNAGIDTWYEAGGDANLREIMDKAFALVKAQVTSTNHSHEADVHAPGS